MCSPLPSPASVTKFDTTANQLFTLSEQTEKLVGGLPDEVTVYWIVRSGREESYLESLLSRYQSLSDKIRVVKKDPDVFPHLHPAVYRQLHGKQPDRGGRGAVPVRGL